VPATGEVLDWSDVVDSGADDPVAVGASTSLPVLSRDKLLPDDRLGLPLTELDPSVGASTRRGHGLRTPGTNKPSPI